MAVNDVLTILPQRWKIVKDDAEFLFLIPEEGVQAVLKVPRVKVDSVFLKKEEEDSKDTLAARVKRRRLMLGYTQEDLASLAGMSQANVSLIEHGDTKQLQTKSLAALARALNVDVSYLMVS